MKLKHALECRDRGEVLANSPKIPAATRADSVAAVVLDAVVVAKIFLAFCVLWIWA
jgi:hypothetical protein